jgi:hypothetical protein
MTIVDWAEVALLLCVAVCGLVRVYELIGGRK